MIENEAISMTEVERIIDKGIISKNFLKPETRCGFYVDEKRKKIWTVELDLLMELDRVCKKYNLKYFLNGGTLLGAIRHKGFVPWDDDIDVAMLRGDYEKFKEVATIEFSNPYFIQTPNTDPGYYFSYIKLRNSRTSDISIPFRYEKFNQGIAIDIFVFDNCLKEEMESINKTVAEMIADNSAYMRKSNPNPTEEDLRRINNHSGKNPMDVCDQLTQIAKKYANIETENVCDILSIVYDVDRRIWNRQVFDKVVYKSFEGFEFPVPWQYDVFLSTLYKNYMEFPPVEKRGNWHEGEIFEPDIPYEEFIKTIR